LVHLLRDGRHDPSAQLFPVVKQFDSTAELTALIGFATFGSNWFPVIVYRLKVFAPAKTMFRCWVWLGEVNELPMIVVIPIVFSPGVKRIVGLESWAMFKVLLSMNKFPTTRPSTAAAGGAVFREPCASMMQTARQDRNTQPLISYPSTFPIRSASPPP